MKIKATVLVLACSGWSMAWAANKCVGADGAVVFQDAPCPASMKTVSEPAPQVARQPKPVMTAAEVARSLNAQMDSPENQQRVQAARDRRATDLKALEDGVRADRANCGADGLSAQPVIGMSESRFLSCTRFAREWAHTRVNETETAYGIRRQYVYGQSAPIRYVYTEQGAVVSITR